jgi:RNA polymerase sigma factor (sigma-70 family)
MLTWVESDELQRLREGDSSAMASIFDRYADRLKYVVMRQPARLSEEVAEDITVEAFMAFLKWSRWSESAYKRLHSIGGYLYKTATTLVFTESRRIRDDGKLKEKIAREPVSRPPQPDRIALDNEIHRLLDDAVGRLPEDYQPTARYKFVHELTDDETAKLTGASKSTTKKRIARIKQLLAKALRFHLFGDRQNGNGNGNHANRANGTNGVDGTNQGDGTNKVDGSNDDTNQDKGATQ